MEVGFTVAFVAGALSISSPCVLPLLPIYLVHLAGQGQDGTLPPRSVVLAHAAVFVFGFGVVFVALGASLGAVGEAVQAYRDWLTRVGGAFMLLLGLNLLGIVRVPFLERAHRLRVPGAGDRPGRLSSSFLVGVGFAAGWTPCAGPVLGAILTLAIGSAGPGRAAALLAVYAAGLAIPFLLAAATLGGVVRPMRRAGAALTVGSGAVMTAVGTLMILGIYQQVFVRLVGAAPWTPWEPRF